MAYSKFFLLLATSFVFQSIAMVAEARPFRVDDIPNGSKFGCLNCHGDTKASYNTDFGSDARTYLIVNAGAVSTQHVEWGPLCAFDSDRDGWTNGQELGDPNCVWKLGDPAPKGLITNPGVYESAPPPVCGSGKLEANEACDGDLLSTKNCALVGAGEGTLACTADCKFDYSGCSAAPGTTPIPDSTGSSDEEGGCSVGSVPASGGDAWIFWGLVGAVFVHARRKAKP